MSRFRFAYWRFTFIRCRSVMSCIWKLLPKLTKILLFQTKKSKSVSTLFFIDSDMLRYYWFASTSVHALLTELMKREQAIMSASTALAELDWSVCSSLITVVLRHPSLTLYDPSLIALAEAARIYEWSRPNMTEENVTRIRKFVSQLFKVWQHCWLFPVFRFRHPLVELCVDSFVQNDVSLVGSRGVNWNTNGEEVEIPLEGTLDPELSMLVVTVSKLGIIYTNYILISLRSKQGANYSGKSVYLKTIALLTFMAQIGMSNVSRSILVLIRSIRWTRFLHTSWKSSNWDHRSNFDQDFYSRVYQSGMSLTHMGLIDLDWFFSILGFFGIYDRSSTNLVGRFPLSFLSTF